MKRQDFESEACVEHSIGGIVVWKPLHRRKLELVSPTLILAMKETMKCIGHVLYAMHAKG